MAVVLDTSMVPDRERFERVRVAMAETSASSVVLPGDGPRSTLGWTYGSWVQLSVSCRDLAGADVAE